MSLPPLTPRAQEVAEAVKRYGTQAKASRALGISETAVSQHYALYLEHHPEEAPARPPVTLEALDQRMAAFDQRLDRLEHLIGRLDAFTKRLPNMIRNALISAGLKVAEVRLPIPSTRRIKDGGRHGSAYWREHDHDQDPGRPHQQRVRKPKRPRV
jgi:hypothetical protein